MPHVNSTNWDQVYNDFKGNRFSVWKEDATPFFVDHIKFLKEKKVEQILDAGCGDGRNLLVFAQAGFEITGMDGSAQACEKAKRVVKLFPSTKIIQHDLATFDLENKFDAIICDFVFVHLESGEKVIQNFFNALKPNGYLLIEFLSTDDPACGKGESVGENCFINKGIFHHFYSLDQANELLKNFEILETKKIKHKDPEHTSDYPRDTRHVHDSIYVLCQKI